MGSLQKRRSHRLHEIPGALLTASANGNGHEVSTVGVEDLVERIEACLLAAKSSAGGPSAAAPLKLRKEISIAEEVCASNKVVQTQAIKTAARPK